MLDIGLLLIRLVVGLIFMGHGLQKLAGWFGGYGLAGTGQFMESLRLRPGRYWAALAGTAELLGGLLSGLGFLNPVGSVLIAAVMIMAIYRVHLSKGLWNDNGGMEYPLVNLTVVIALGLIGPGAYAMDAAYGTGFSPLPVLLVGLALAVIVALTGWPAMRIIRPRIPAP